MLYEIKIISLDVKLSLIRSRDLHLKSRDRGASGVGECGLASQMKRENIFIF